MRILDLKFGMEDIKQVEHWLDSYTKHGIKDLDRMQRILHEFDDPQLVTPAIHVTGTNGKGSTCRFIEQIACDQGYDTLLFTSPHLVQLTERIRHNKANIDEETFIKLMNKVRQYIEKHNIQGMTYFEVLTIIFFIYAGQVKVDLMIVEVGVGGEDDYTNVLPSAVRVITSIGRDHIPALGQNESEITVKKTGIIHAGDTVVIGEMAAEYETIIQDKVSACKGHLISYLSEDDIDLPQLGFYQAWNARTAIAAVRHFARNHHYHFDEASGLQSVKSTALPGRLEEVGHFPKTYIDGAHNISAIQVLVEELATTFKGRKITMYFSSLERKKVAESLDFILSHDFIDLRLTTFNEDGARKSQDYVVATGAKYVENWYDDYISIAQHVPEAIVVFCGSFYFISEVREKLQSEDKYEDISNF